MFSLERAECGWSCRGGNVRWITNRLQKALYGPVCVMLSKMIPVVIVEVWRVVHHVCPGQYEVTVSVTEVAKRTREIDFRASTEDCIRCWLIWRVFSCAINNCYKLEKVRKWSDDSVCRHIALKTQENIHIKEAWIWEFWLFNRLIVKTLNLIDD